MRISDWSSDVCSSDRRHCGHYPFGLREFHRLLRGPDYARRLVARAAAAGVALHTATTVLGPLPGPRLLLSTPGGRAALAARTSGVQGQSVSVRVDPGGRSHLTRNKTRKHKRYT